MQVGIIQSTEGLYRIKRQSKSLFAFFHLSRAARTLTFSFLFFFSWPHRAAPRLGIKPMPPAVKEQSLNHWTTREVLILRLLNLRLNTSSPPNSQAFGLGLNYTTSFPGLPACRQQIVGLLKSPYSSEPIPIINLHISG